MSGLKRGGAAIVGAAESDLGQVADGMSPLDLMAQGTQRALADCGLALKDVDGLFCATAQSRLSVLAFAEYLGVPALTFARHIEIDGGRLRVKRETETGYQTVSAPLPALASITKSANEPRYPSLKGIMGAKKKDIKTLALADLGLTKAVGSDGSRTEVLALATPPAREKGRTVTAADGADGARIVLDFLTSRQLL